MNPTIELLLTRRSVAAKDLGEPGPDAEQLRTILQAAHRVPDHGKLGPWRFIVFEGEQRRLFGNELATIFANDNPDSSEKLLSFESARFMRAPLIIALIASAHEDHPKIPLWEQQLCLGAVAQNLLTASHAMGFGAQWLTEWYSYHREVNNLLGLQTSERVAGFFYIGTPQFAPSERVRPELDERVSFWQGRHQK